MKVGTPVATPEDDQYNEHHHGTTAFSSYRVPHQRHKRLLANSRRGSFARNLGKMRHAGEANPRFPDTRDEFANSVKSSILTVTSTPSTDSG